MLGKGLLVVASFIMCLTGPGLAAAETRIALVIGNAEYEGSLVPLANPVNDADLIGASLAKVGFKVITVRDASQKEMKRAIADFGAAILAGGDDVISLFYYAGHGLQVDGINYLVPVDAEIEHEGDVDIESVAADAVLKQMEHAGASTSIVILDACRNNPLKRSAFRSASRGLARMDAPNGSFIAYSTAPGDVAADGTGTNSPFASALATEMVKSGQAIEETFRNVRIEVMQRTAEAQTPWDSSSMIRPFYFAPGAASQAEKATAPDLPASQSSPQPAVQPSAPPPEAAAISAAPDAAESDFSSPLPDGTIVLSRAVKAELDTYLARSAQMPDALGGYKWAFFYVSEDGRHSGSYFCRADLAESGDCPTNEMNTGSTTQSRQRAQRACEAKAATPCVYLYRGEEQKSDYRTLD